MNGADGGQMELMDLIAQVQQLTQVVSFVQTQQQAATAAAATPPPRCPVNPPEKFDGNVDEFPAFLAQCKLYIELRARDLPNDKTKVLDLNWNEDALMDQYAEELADDVLD
ncbi:UNVERIFIED_CONTAM: hypothetical protein K2H54_053445 [Gekko kuhli]